MSDGVPAAKDPDREHPVPTVWRTRLAQFVHALVVGDYAFTSVAEVDLTHAATADDLAAQIRAYGCTLIPLPEASWETSVCSWQEAYWDVLVDLFTAEEGRSDLVMQVRVYEAAGGVRFAVQNVFVP